MNDQLPPGAPSLFSQLVIMLSSSVMQQLGMVPAPDGTQTPVDLEASEGMIEILAELQKKTTGNLDEAEDALLGEALTSLQMLFVQAKGGAPIGQAAPPPPPPEAAPPADGEKSDGGDDGDDSEPRFKKSYG